MEFIKIIISILSAISMMLNALSLGDQPSLSGFLSPSMGVSVSEAASPGVHITAAAATENKNTSSVYPRIATVTDLDRQRGIVTFTDAYGFSWQMYGCEDWALGDTAAMMMNDMGTPSIKDDTIIKAHYQYPAG